MARKNYTARIKVKVAIDAVKEEHTMAELTSKYGVHRNQIRKWKEDALTGLTDMFSKKADKNYKSDEELISKLYQQIGRLQVENDWLKKTV